jgi:hypothetical protein
MHVHVTHSSNSASVIPKYVSNNWQVSPEEYSTHCVQSSVVPGAAVPAGETRYASAREVARKGQKRCAGFITEAIEERCPGWYRNSVRIAAFECLQ